MSFSRTSKLCVNPSLNKFKVYICAHKGRIRYQYVSRLYTSSSSRNQCGIFIRRILEKVKSALSFTDKSQAIDIPLLSPIRGSSSTVVPPFKQHSHNYLVTVSNVKATLDNHVYILKKTVATPKNVIPLCTIDYKYDSNETKKDSGEQFSASLFSYPGLPNNSNKGSSKDTSCLSGAEPALETNKIKSLNSSTFNPYPVHDKSNTYRNNNQQNAKSKVSLNCRNRDNISIYGKNYYGNNSSNFNEVGMCSNVVSTNDNEASANYIDLCYLSKKNSSSKVGKCCPLLNINPSDIYTNSKQNTSYGNEKKLLQGSSNCDNIMVLNPQLPKLRTIFYFHNKNAYIIQPKLDDLSPVVQYISQLNETSSTNKPGRINVVEFCKEPIITNKNLLTSCEKSFELSGSVAGNTFNESKFDYCKLDRQYIIYKKEKSVSCENMDNKYWIPTIDEDISSISNRNEFTAIQNVSDHSNENDISNAQFPSKNKKSFEHNLLDNKDKLDPYTFKIPINKDKLIEETVVPNKSILNIINSIDKSAVIIQKDLYITDRIIQKIKNEKKQKHEKPKLETSNGFVEDNIGEHVLYFDIQSIDKTGNVKLLLCDLTNLSKTNEDGIKNSWSSKTSEKENDISKTNNKFDGEVVVLENCDSGEILISKPNMKEVQGIVSFSIIGNTKYKGFSTIDIIKKTAALLQKEKYQQKKVSESKEANTKRKTNIPIKSTNIPKQSPTNFQPNHNLHENEKPFRNITNPYIIQKSTSDKTNLQEHKVKSNEIPHCLLVRGCEIESINDRGKNAIKDKNNPRNTQNEAPISTNINNNIEIHANGNFKEQVLEDNNHLSAHKADIIMKENIQNHVVQIQGNNNTTFDSLDDMSVKQSSSLISEKSPELAEPDNINREEIKLVNAQPRPMVFKQNGCENEVSDSKPLNNLNYSMINDYLVASKSSIIENTERNKNMEAVSAAFVQSVKTNDNNQSKEQYDNNLSPKNTPEYENNGEKYDTIHERMSDIIPTLECPSLIDSSVKCLMSSKGKNDQGSALNRNVVSVNNAGSIVKKKTPTISHVTKTSITATRKNGMSDISVSEKETVIDSRVPVPFSTETFFQIFGTSMSLQNVTKLVDNTKNQLISSTLSSHIKNTKEILSKLDEIINVIKCSQKSSLENLRDKNSKTEAHLKSTPQTVTNITPKIIDGVPQIQGKNELGKTINQPVPSQNVEKKVSGRKIRLRRQNSNPVTEKGKVTNQEQERPTSSKSKNIKLSVFKDGKNTDISDRRKDSKSVTEKLQIQMNKKGVKMSPESVKLKSVTINSDSRDKRKETAANKKENVLDNNAVSENINNYVHLLKSTGKQSKPSKSKSKRLGFFEHKSLSKRDKKILKEILKGAPKRRKVTKVRRAKEDPMKSKPQDLKAPSSAGDGPYKPKPFKQGSTPLKVKTNMEKDKTLMKPPVSKEKGISEAKREGSKLVAPQPKDIPHEHKKESVYLTKPENKTDKNILSSPKPKEDMTGIRVFKEKPLHTKNDTMKYKLDKSSGMKNENKRSEKKCISPTEKTKSPEKIAVLSKKAGPVATMNELNSPNEFLQKENKTDPSKYKSNISQEKELPLVGEQKVTTDNKIKSKSTVEGSLNPKERNKNIVLKTDKPEEKKSDKDNVNTSNKIVNKELSHMNKPPKETPNKQKTPKTMSDKVVMKSTDKNAEEVQFSGVSSEMRTNNALSSSKKKQETITSNTNQSELLVNKSSSIKSPQEAKKNLELDSSNLNTRKNNQENKMSHKSKNSDVKTVAKHNDLNADIKETKSKDLDLKTLSPEQLAAEKENKSSAIKKENGPGVNSSPSFQIYVATKTYVDPKNQAKYSPPKSPSLNQNKLKKSAKKAKTPIQKAGRRQFEPPSQKVPNAVNPQEGNNSGVTVIEVKTPKDIDKDYHKEKFKTELMRSVKKKIEMRNPIHFRVNSKKITSPQKEPSIKTPESPSKKVVLKQSSKKFTAQQMKHPSKEKKKELSSSQSVAKPASKKIRKQPGKDINSKSVQLKQKTSPSRLSRGSKTLKVYAERSMKKDDEIKSDSSTLKEQKLVNPSKEDSRSKIKKESQQEVERTKTNYDKSLESKTSEVDTKSDKMARIENIKPKSNQTNEVMRSQLLQEKPIKKDMQSAEEVKFNEEKKVHKTQMTTETKNNSEVINKDINIKLNAQGLKEKNIKPTFSQAGVSKGDNEAEAVGTKKDQIPFPMLLVDLDKMTKEIKPDLDITNCHKCSIPINKIEDYPIFNSKKVGGFVCPNSVLNICPSKDPMLRKDLSFLPSVTKILNLTLPKNSREVLREWRRTMIKELGENGFKSFYKGQMTRGTQFHNLIQDHLIWGRGRETPSTLCFQSVHHVLSELTDLAAINTHVVHKNLAYRGVVDCVAKYKNKPVVVEWKRLDQKEVLGLSSLEASCLQLSAYIGALNFDENYKFQVKGGIIVIAYSDGNKADVHEFDYRECDKYWKLWLSRLQKYHSFLQNRKNKE